MDLATLETRQNKLVVDASAMLELAQKEGRGLSADENTRHDDLINDLKAVNKSIATLKSDQGFDVFRQFDPTTELAIGNAVERHVGRISTKSLGVQFAESKAGEVLKQLAKDGWPRTWTTGIVELKATLTEDPASGGALVTPQVLPGITPVPMGVPTLVSLFAPGTTSSGLVQYMKVKTQVNAAGGVAEGAAKPESSLTFEFVTEPLKKIATWLPASTEILEDVAQLRSFIDTWLRLAIAMERDRQILLGAGGAELTGLLTRADLAPPIAVAAATGADDGLDAIARQIAQVQTLSELPVDGIVLHPNDYLTLSLVKTTQGEYLSGGPFVTPTRPMLWGRTVALSTKMTVGQALVGSFKGAAQFIEKGGIRVEASNSHQDYFIKNLVALLAEGRALLAVRQPLGFGVVTNVTGA